MQPKIPRSAPSDVAPSLAREGAAAEGVVAAGRAPSLGEIEASPVSERRLVAKSGAFAVLKESDVTSRIEVRDASARLVFELDLTTGHAVLNAPGDLSLRAGGDVDIDAKGTLRCAGAEVDIAARGPLRLSSRILKAAADRAELALRDTSLSGDRLAATLGDAKLVATRIETAADRIFERARNVFRAVEDLHQLAAGRSRELVSGGVQIKAGHVAVDADDDVKIDGKSIHLG